MGSSTTYSAPGPSAEETAYYSYMTKAQEAKDKATAAAAEEEKTQLAAVKSTGTSGYGSYKQSLLNQYQAGLIDDQEAIKQLKDYEDRYKLGTGYTLSDITTLTDTATKGAATKYDLLAGQTYKDVLGREATKDELSGFEKLMGTGKYKLTDLVTSIKSGSEYQDKFNQNYLDSYYDTMYGEQTTATGTDGKVTKTGKRTFTYDSSLDPTFTDDTAAKTGIKSATTASGFTGTAAEIEEYQQSLRQKRDFMYNAGLTNLQGQIDKDTQKIKNQGAAEVAKIGSQGQVLSSLVGGFWG